MKYVMINEIYPICFPDNLNHSSFKEVGKITSAGFVAVDKITKGVVTYGESISLKKMVPNKDDKIILEVFLKGYSELDITNLALLQMIKVMELRKDKK
jgi:hypothetical protein